MVDPIDQMLMFQVRAVDEFDRVFNATYVIPNDVIIYAKFSYIDWIYERLIKDILVPMGTAAWASWEGEIRVLN